MKKKVETKGKNEWNRREKKGKKKKNEINGKRR